MASSVKKGGGVENGKIAQEEDLYRCSNLCTIKDSLYPLEQTKYIYSSDVSFFKDSTYQKVANSFVDVISIAAPNLNPNVKDEHLYIDYHTALTILDTKINQIIQEGILNHCDTLILGAFGCGVFKHSPKDVAYTFKNLLKNTPFERVIFAIIDNETTNNYQIFKEVFSK